MAIYRSLRPNPARRNTLAACLAAALSAGVAGASPPSAVALPGHAQSNPLRASRVPGFGEAFDWARQEAGVQVPTAMPLHPASTITVDHCTDDFDTGSLRWAFAAAQDGDVIDLSTLTCAESRITLTNGEIVATVPNLSVQGPGQDLLALDGGNSSRVFRSNYGLTISDLTIARGGNDTGFAGCILVIDDLTLTRSTVSGCRAGDGSNTGAFGGGVSVGGDLTLHSSTITNNDATAVGRAYGGGAYVYKNAYLDDSAISGNATAAAFGHARGGGLFVNGNVVVSGSRLLQNTASSVDGAAYGGGIHGSASITVAASSTIGGNTAHSDAGASSGGGIHGANSGSTITLRTSTLSSNTASTSCTQCAILIIGGGASMYGSIRAYDSTVSDNHVVSPSDSMIWAAGGGLATFAYGNGGEIVLTDSTVSANSADGGSNGGFGYGGGIAAIASSPFVVRNSTIAFNRASHAAGGATGSANGVYASTLESTIVANNRALGVADDIAPADPADSFVIHGSRNLVMASTGILFDAEEPIHGDPLLMPLADNGGPTQTHALAVGSPAIDAGNNSWGLFYDQRGCPHRRVEGAAADIGAFETSDDIFVDGFDGAPVCP